MMDIILYMKSLLQKSAFYTNELCNEQSERTQCKKRGCHASVGGCPGRGLGCLFVVRFCHGLCFPPPTGKPGNCRV